MLPKDNVERAVEALADDVLNILYDFNSYYEAVIYLIDREPNLRTLALRYEHCLADNSNSPSWRVVEEHYYLTAWNPSSRRVLTMLLGRLQQLIS